MRCYAPLLDLTLSIPLIGLDGTSLTATAGTWRLTDGEGTELLASASLDITDPVTVVSVAVLAANNTVPTGEPYSVRIVELELTTAEGTHRQAHGYMLLSSEPLQIGVNSFQSLHAADALAQMIPGTTAYRSASVTDKIGAMSFAREQLCLLEYKAARDSQSYLINDHPVVGESYTDLSELTSLEIGLMNSGFRKALCRAQVIQADHLLGGDAAERARQEGVMSITVGESSQMFRAGMRPLETPICRRAIAALHGYLVNPFACKIGRS